MYGGTGRSFNLDLAKIAIKTGKKIIVAGGVSEDNIYDILQISPYGVDINSSIEDRPGKKNIKKMGKIVKQIRDYTG